MSTLYTALAIVGSLSVYITICGLFFALTPKKWEDDAKLIGSCLWPLTIAVFAIIKLLLIGPRVAKWHAQRASLPRAIARFEKERKEGP